MYEYHFHQGGMASKLQAEIGNTTWVSLACQLIGQISTLKHAHPLHGVQATLQPWFVHQNSPSN
jgi:hypothetical protein